MPSNSPTAEPLAPGLYVVTTPIGNLADITLRALSVLASADLIAAEDTRQTKRLLAAHNIQGRLISYHEHNEQQRTPELVALLEKGQAIALVSDAGTPTVSDPGYRLVQSAAGRKIPIIPIPGVSAAIAALSVSGLPTDQFTFVGFPARKKSKMVAQLNALAAITHTLIFYQSPQRLLAFAQELLKAFGDRHAVLAREMTKMHEEFLRGTLSEIIGDLTQRERIKGECTLLVAGAPETDDAIDDGSIDAAIREALASGDQSVNDIAKMLAGTTGQSKKQLYQRVLAMRERVKAGK